MKNTLIKVQRHKNIQAEMLEDFGRELGEMRKLLVCGSERERERARGRIQVIGESVEELKKQMSNPLRHQMMVEGGYSNDEIARFQEKFQKQYDS
jgi:DNA-binding transcriptional MerR regulator